MGGVSSVPPAPPHWSGGWARGPGGQYRRLGGPQDGKGFSGLYAFCSHLTGMAETSFRCSNPAHQGNRLPAVVWVSPLSSVASHVCLKKAGCTRGLACMGWGWLGVRVTVCMCDCVAAGATGTEARSLMSHGGIGLQACQLGRPNQLSCTHVHFPGRPQICKNCMAAQ